jgi:anti-anti-sigma regulatory factor
MAKPTFNLSKSINNKEIVFSIRGELSMQHASEIATQFLKAKKENGDITVSLDHVTSFDIIAFQLTYLLKKEIECDGRKVVVTLPVNPTLRALLEKTGVTKFL